MLLPSSRQSDCPPNPQTLLFFFWHSTDSCSKSLLVPPLFDTVFLVMPMTIACLSERTCPDAYHLLSHPGAICLFSYAFHFSAASSSPSSVPSLKFICLFHARLLLTMPVSLYLCLLLASLVLTALMLLLFALFVLPYFDYLHSGVHCRRTVGDIV